MPSEREPVTVISIVTAPGGEPGDAVARLLAWVVPSGLAGAFAQAMTERFGEPVTEAMTTVLAAIEHARSDRTVYLDRMEIPDV